MDVMQKMIGIAMMTLGAALMAACVWSLVEIVRIALGGIQDQEYSHVYLTLLMLAFVLCSRFGYSLFRQGQFRLHWDEEDHSD